MLKSDILFSLVAKPCVGRDFVLDHQHGLLRPVFGNGKCKNRIANRSASTSSLDADFPFVFDWIGKGHAFDWRRFFFFRIGFGCGLAGFRGADVLGWFDFVGSRLFGRCRIGLFTGSFFAALNGQALSASVIANAS